MFFGEFHHSLDDKGRLTLPADFRGPLMTGGFIAQLGPCLIAYPAGLWKTEVVDEIDRQVRAREVTADTRRAIWASTRALQPDSQGRVVLSPEHRAYAGLAREVVILGHSLRIEFWSPERWREHKADGEARLADALEVISL